MARLNKLYRKRSDRAVERAKAVLKEGDRIRATRCGGGSPTFTFVGWEGRWITSRTRDDISPMCVIAVNGVPTSFDDDPEAHLADPFRGVDPIYLEPDPS